MLVLAIETSCDETAVAVVKDGKEIISNLVASQIKIHAPYHGVVPELASRAHIEKIIPLINKALNRNQKIDLVAFTAGPGLIGSLLIGEIAAKFLSYCLKVPFIGVNHLEGHIFSVFFDNDISPPFITLIVSGGHTELLIFESFGKYKMLGQTKDDAAGESFDKVAKMLNLSYPGGPIIDELSKRGNPKSINFPRPFLWDSWDFSFSGLKTAVLYYLKKQKKIKKQMIPDIASSFQQAVIEVLIEKSIKAAKVFNIDKVAIVGGVAANKKLREYAKNRGLEESVNFYFPKPELSTDNAAMIASVAYFKYISNLKNVIVNSDPNLRLQNW